MIPVVQPTSSGVMSEEKSVTFEEVKIYQDKQTDAKWTPLIEKQEADEARKYGHSFGSKKVAMGPGFLNLRFMCHCLAKAVKKHIDFS